MIPLIVLVISFLAFRLTGLVVTYFADWQFALRAALGVMFLVTASAHWGRLRPDLIRMVPRGLGNPEHLVTLTGVAEILMAIGLQVPQAAMTVAGLAAAMLACILPANVKAAREGLTIGGRRVPGMGLRISMQLVFVFWPWYVRCGQDPDQGHTRNSGFQQEARALLVIWIEGFPQVFLDCDALT